jgi:hypothetical protein
VNLYGLLSEECGSWEYNYGEPPEPGCDVYIIAAETRAKAVYLWARKRRETFADLPKYSCRKLGEANWVTSSGIIADYILPESIYNYWWDRFAEVMPQEVK